MKQKIFYHLSAEELRKALEYYINREASNNCLIKLPDSWVIPDGINVEMIQANKDEKFH